MYAGRIVEEADVKTIFKNPVHPYTQGLLQSIPRIDEAQRPRRLSEIPGRVPNLSLLPPGCAFFDRCPVGMDQCRSQKPQLEPHADGHWVSCWKA
jgi:oligopeptide/dipeptide ABC transporter ATP-binding protein